MLDTLLQSLQVAEATVTATPGTGDVHVRLGDDAGDEADVVCRLLETAAGPPLVFAEGDRVLVATLRDGGTGYVLGRVARHVPAGPGQPGPEAGRVVEVVVPEGVETVRIAGRRITIAADESLALECGGGSVKIDKRGKVVVLGTDITSRAKRLHKVKGASVAIN